MEVAERVQAARRQLAATRREREFAVERNPCTALDERAALPPGAEPQALEPEQAETVNPSYRPATSTSAGPRSVRDHSGRRLPPPSVTVMSSHWSHDARP